MTTSSDAPPSCGSLAYPKRVRLKKAWKPLKRTPLARKTPLRRSRKPIARLTPIRQTRGRDPAAFIHAEVGAVYGSRPECVISGQNAYDVSHILGRGEAFGFKKSHPDRYLFSSPFGCAPLVRHHHAGPHRDKPAVRWLLLQIAEDAVMKAVAEGFYEINERDRRFIAEIRDPWKAKNPA